MSVYYLAHISAYKVSKYEGTGRGDDKTTKTDDVKLTVKSESLEGLKKKVTAMLDIIDESEFMS